jgi:hypothetical protein
MLRAVGDALDVGCFPNKSNSPMPLKKTSKSFTFSTVPAQTIRSSRYKPRRGRHFRFFNLLFFNKYKTHSNQESCSRMYGDLEKHAFSATIMVYMHLNHIRQTPYGVRIPIFTQRCSVGGATSSDLSRCVIRHLQRLGFQTPIFKTIQVNPHFS